MRTKQEIIEAYLGYEKVGDVTPKEIDTTMGGELVKDVMNLWGEELLNAVVEEIGNVDRKQAPEYLTDTCDVQLMKIVNTVRQQMYPAAKFE